MYVKKFLKTLNSDNTIQAYERAIVDMLETIKKPESQINSMDLEDWTHNFSHLSSASIAQKIQGVKKYFKYLTKHQIITSNPALSLEVPKVVHKPKEFIPYDKILLLIESTKNIRLKAILAIFLNTGLRVQELIDLQLEAYLYFIKTGTPITIETKGGKYRKIIFNKTTQQYINDYLQIRKEGISNLFVSNHGTPMNGKCLNKTLKRAVEKAGLDYKKITNHSIRSTAATHVYENHGIVATQQFLDHSDISTTQIYIGGVQNQLNVIMDEDFKSEVIIKNEDESQRRKAS